MKFNKKILFLLSFFMITATLASCNNDEITLKKHDLHVHTYDEWQITNNATCTANGSKKRICSDCGDVDTEEIEAYGHVYEKNVCKTCNYKADSEGLLYELNSEKTGYMVSGIGNCDDIEIVIPKKYNSLPIVGIKEKAFYQNNDIISVTTSEELKTIGKNAFYECFNLSSVTLSNNVEKIEENAFNGCKRLYEVFNTSSLNITFGSKNNGCVGFYAKIIHKTISEKSVIINNYDGYLFMFFGEKYHLINYIGDNTELVLPNDINSNDYVIYKNAFESSDITSVTLSNGVIGINSFSFSNCTNLICLYIPLSVLNIDNNAFSVCNSLVIDCEAEEKPSTWEELWNFNNYQVNWNVKK